MTALPRAFQYPPERLTAHRLPPYHGNSVEGIPNFSSKGLRYEGLLEERDIGGEQALMDCRALRVTGHQEYLHVRAHRVQAAGQIDSGHTGHRNVADHQVDL